jgi:hypothetical protein
MMADFAQLISADTAFIFIFAISQPRHFFGAFRFQLQV